MWNQVALIASGLLLCAFASAAEPKIDASKASSYVGESVKACGILAEINHLPNRHYMNLDKNYPNQSLTVLLWHKDYIWFERRFGKIDNYVGNRFCVTGTIVSVQNRLQINLTNPQLLRLVPNK